MTGVQQLISSYILSSIARSTQSAALKEGIFRNTILAYTRHLTAGNSQCNSPSDCFSEHFHYSLLAEHLNRSPPYKLSSQTLPGVSEQGPIQRVTASRNFVSGTLCTIFKVQNTRFHSESVCTESMDYTACYLTNILSLSILTK